MKIVTAALCVLSVGVLSGCVDDRGYRGGGGYYASSTVTRTHDRDRYNRYNRHYDRDYRRDRDYRGDRGNWRGDHRRYPPAGGGTQYGVIIR